MIEYGTYQGEAQLDDLIRLISQDLSEPYSIFTYRYFLQNWPRLCITGLQAIDEESGELVGLAMGKIEDDPTEGRRGYVAMLVVDSSYRGKSIGTKLVKILLEAMIHEGVSLVFLETEASNFRALQLYAKLGFVREQRLPRYYLNGSDAFRLKLWTM